MPVPDHFAGFSESAALDLSNLSPGLARQVCDRLISREFGAWAEALARVGNCARPIRLRGRSDTVDRATGEILSSYSSGDESLGTTYVRCGNRRASECLSCSRLYAADMFHLIRSGVSGGKTVPSSIAEHPLVFATLTAPSFGKVHGQRVDGARCHPPAREPQLCRHGRPRSCLAVHDDGDTDRHGATLIGQPLCQDCYDYSSQVVWQWWAPDLWRRFTIALRRLVARTLGVRATSNPRGGDGPVCQGGGVPAAWRDPLPRPGPPRRPPDHRRLRPCPPAIDADRLAGLVTEAASSVHLQVPGVDDDDPGRLLVFGRQLEVRPVSSL